MLDEAGEFPVRMEDMRQDLFSALPHLRAFAISLTGDVDRADDLVQEAVVRGLSHLHQFKRGTNFQGWMFTILRNQFHSNYRKRRREVEDADGIYAAKFAIPPEQGAHLDFERFPHARWRSSRPSSARRSSSSARRVSPMRRQRRSATPRSAPSRAA